MSAEVATVAGKATGGSGSGAAKPESALVSFTAALSRGDLQGASACFTREGCLITPDHTSVYGREDIAGVLAQLIAARTEIEIDRVVVRQAGEVALASGRVTMRSDGPEGTRFAQTCDPTMVIQRVEGTWKLAVIAPWGSR
jgi:ketosteroid isomerase-like protein